MKNTNELALDKIVKAFKEKFGCSDEELVVVKSHFKALLDRNENFAEAVNRESKTGNGLFAYVSKEIRDAHKKSSCVAVGHNEVFNYAEEYFWNDSEDEETKPIKTTVKSIGKPMPKTTKTVENTEDTQLSFATLFATLNETEYNEDCDEEDDDDEVEIICDDEDYDDDDEDCEDEDCEEDEDDEEELDSIFDYGLF